jgi:hypothetical protein
MEMVFNMALTALPDLLKKLPAMRAAVSDADREND